ncbi:MAG: DsrE/DsrF/DrsH-like family protein [Thermoplasmatota archaeon]
MAQLPVVNQVQEEKLCIILSKGTLDMAYPAFMLAQTAAAMGSEVHVFFTFWGMNAVDRRHVDKLEVASVGNPGLPMPNILGMLPGMTWIATKMMKGKIAKAKLAPLHDMIKDAAAMGVHLHACSTTMEVMGVAKENLIPEVESVVGAATFLEMAHGGQTLFI